MLRVCTLVFSLISGAELTFEYQPLYRRNNEPCKICYGDECVQMDQARCEYYVETEGIMHEEEMEGEDNPVMREEVDKLMYRFMEKASTKQTECVPLVSQYTDCTKENICTGCKTCSCDVNGVWNCSKISKCRADAAMDVDHRMLVFIIKHIMNIQNNKRTKRYIEENLNKLDRNNITFDQISQWMFEDPPSNTEETTQNTPKFTAETETSITNSETSTQTVNTIKGTSPTADYLGFEEVLSNIAVDGEAYSRRKPLDIHIDSTPFDYMLFDEGNATDVITNKPEFENVKNNYAPLNTDGETDIVIDLLESAKKNQGETFTANWTDYTETDNKINMIDPVLDYVDNFVLGSKNLMKRDIAVNEINTEKVNITSNIKELRNNVLLPLSNIINDKQRELEELLRVSENLIKIMRSNKNGSFEAPFKENNSHKFSNSSISTYNLEISHELENDFRSDNSLLQKYIIKLKRDIYEVIRDIAGIQKFKGTSNIPQDFKTLLHAMKRYVRGQAKVNNGQENKLNSVTSKSRRKFDNTTNELNKKNLASEMVDIFTIIDKSMPESNALSALSATSRKIIQRVIKNNYIDEFSVVGLRVFNPEYNLTKDLRNIGTEWPRMTDTITHTPVQDRLYALKLLHLILSIDITKMNDALALLDFAYNRRMILVEGNLDGDIIDRINKGLKAINEKIKVIITLHKSKQVRNFHNLEVTKKVQKESFLKKLKNILRSSKSDILSLLKKKVPKKEILKGLAQKKVDELTKRRFMEFEDTMRKWQSKLNLVPRDKRFARDDNYKNRMKNILPKYLRGKVKPAITAKKSKMSRKHGKQKKHSQAKTMKSKLNAK